MNRDERKTMALDTLEKSTAMTQKGRKATYYSTEQMKQMKEEQMENFNGN